ncbi:PREDICTED: uncharacterized protein LOC109221851 [Nicotiana attenuata]|uniref:uncharacterized protein LOC109221851 n=1 Tax=Nicotiana attenuata TaxID=49451 RepID=UPI000905B1CC|nr:PREDICTED: uncharacterized protein LOC109221851 [Nicotiana attenuata]
MAGIPSQNVLPTDLPVNSPVTEGPFPAMGDAELVETAEKSPPAPAESSSDGEEERPLIRRRVVFSPAPPVVINLDSPPTDAERGAVAAPALEGEQSMGVALAGLGHEDAVTSVTQSVVPVAETGGSSSAAGNVGELSAPLAAAAGDSTSPAAEGGRDAGSSLVPQFELLCSEAENASLRGVTDVGLMNEVAAMGLRPWRGLLMREPSPGEVDTPKPAKEKKRKKKSPAESSKPKKAKVQKPKVDSAALTSEAAESPRAGGKEKDDFPLAPGASTSASDLAEPMAVEPKASKPEVADVIPPRADEALEGGSDDASESVDSQKISRVAGCSIDELEDPSSEVPMRHEKASIDPAGVIDVGNSPPGPASSPRKIRDAHNRGTSDAGASLEENDVDELKALFTKREEELHDLRARLDTLEKKDSLMREGLRARDIEILGLKQRVDEMASERDTLQGKLTSVEHHLQDARADSSKYKDLHAELVAALSVAKSEADALISSYREDAAAANAQARNRQALEDVHVGGIDLSAEIERVKALEEESTVLLSFDDDSASGSASGLEDDENEGEVPEGEEAINIPGVEGQAVEGSTSEGAPSGQVTPAVD